MPENTTKRIAVTFGTGLPNGTYAHFKHEGQMWIAYPMNKNQRILAVIDRMIGIFSGLTRDMVGWLNKTPADAPQILTMLNSIARAQRLADEVVTEKIASQTE